MSSSGYCYVANKQLLYLCKKSRFDRFLAGLGLCAGARLGEPGMIGCVQGQLSCEQTDKNEWLLEPMTAFSHPAVTLREIGTWTVWVSPLALAIRTCPPISVQPTSAIGVRVWCRSPALMVLFHLRHCALLDAPFRCVVRVGPLAAPRRRNGAATRSWISRHV